MQSVPYLVSLIRGRQAAGAQPEKPSCTELSARLGNPEYLENPQFDTNAEAGLRTPDSHLG